MKQEALLFLTVLSTVSLSAMKPLKKSTEKTGPIKLGSEYTLINFGKQREELALLLFDQNKKQLPNLYVPVNFQKRIVIKAGDEETPGKLYVTFENGSIRPPTQEEITAAKNWHFDTKDFEKSSETSEHK